MIPEPIIEQMLDAPIEEVWTAFTDTQQMKAWYSNIDTFEPSGKTFMINYRVRVKSSC